jgi:hypothetical protein
VFIKVGQETSVLNLRKKYIIGIVLVGSKYDDLSPVM